MTKAEPKRLTTGAFRRGVERASQQRLALFLDPSRRIYGILWSLCVSLGLQSEKRFRTINVPWIGQWGLFSRCGSS